MRTPVKTSYIVRRARKAGRSPQNWLFERRLFHQMIITEVCCYFLISSTKKQRYIFCKNQTDKAHFRLRMVLSLLTIKPAVNLPNSGKAGYGETNLRCRWSSEEIGECSTKIYFKVCPATKYLLKAKEYRIPYPKSANRNSLRDLKRKDEKQDHLKKCTSFECQCI